MNFSDPAHVLYDCPLREADSGREAAECDTAGSLPHGAPAGGEVGAPLFYHGRNRIGLNANGEKFLQMAERVLRLYDNCIKEIREDNEEFSRTLTIALSAAGSSLPYLIHRFKERHPEAWFVLKGYNHARMDPEVQFCFFCTIFPSKDEEAVCLAKEPLYVTASAAGPLAGQESVALSELSSGSFLFADADNDMQEIQMYYCRKAGFTPDMDNVIERQNILMMLLELGEGVSLLPKINNPNLCSCRCGTFPAAG